MPGKRKNSLTHEECYMAIVGLSALRNLYKYNAACLVDESHRLLNIGINKIPYKISLDKNYDVDHVVSPVFDTIYGFHGNRTEMENGIIYLSEFPDYEDAKRLSQARLKKVVYMTNPYYQSPTEEISHIILDNAGITVEPYYDEQYSKNEYMEFLRHLKGIIKSYVGFSNEKLAQEEYHMGLAILSALRSKDPKTQVGSCLVDQEGKVLSLGYNGLPFGMSDDIMPWSSIGEKTGDLINTKNPYVVHSEINAFDNYRGNIDRLVNAKLYLTFSPCEDCSKRIAVTEISEIICLRDYTYMGMMEANENYFYKNNMSCVPYHKLIQTKEEYNNMMNEVTRVIRSDIGKRYVKMR